ncbi:TM2 domain-containing protein [Amycolatopsis xylanica]|uniref:TM2 domain-containing protein n=1 Tax=Amycolatopsis xylanica TaxID=589385 RepID=A0A1H2RTJ5_9PSEU|nr:DUF1707 domain-containing protein [Amycolatopsis xylanica]SDW22598.1 TM2 domain-containing protein [Amycolatopsis xylanica]
MSTAPEPENLRIGTAEREEAMKVLSDHFAEGRLSTEEYEARVTGVLDAKTRAELRPLFDDLPAPKPVFLLPPMTFAQPAYSPPPPGALPVPHWAPPPPAQYSPKSRMVAGVLQIVFPFGTGRFYTGHTGIAVAQLLVTLFTFGIGAIWPFIDGILLLANGGTDPFGRRLRD